MLTDKQQQLGSPEIWGGFECTINRVGNSYFDQFEYSGHYKRDKDIFAAASLGIKKIRYPILWEKHQRTLDKPIEWGATRQKLGLLQQENISIIAGLVHHGSGPSFTSLQDPQFPYLLADYAGKVAEQFPWIEAYTPVNEPLTTARFSGLYGFWYPHKKNAASFVQMLLNQVKGIGLSMKEIRKINPAAQLVQTEDLCKIYSTPKLQYQARFENQRRWLSYDLLCGKVNKDHPLWKYLLQNGATEKELKFFEENICVPDLFGFNHYLTSERFLDHRLHLYPKHTHGGNKTDSYADVEAVRVPLDEESGLQLLIEEVWDRYKMPIAITEVHLHCHREEQMRWFRYVWQTCNRLVKKGIEIRGVTAWAITGSFGWNKLLTQPKGDYEPGAFDIHNGSVRATALAKLIQNITHDRSDKDHVSDCKGWWQRDDRFFHSYQEVSSQKVKPKLDGLPLLIIGKRGTLGHAFKRIAESRHLHCIALGREDCDISQPGEIEEAIARYKPWAIINAAGYVNVDDAEEDYGTCFMNNTTGPENLADACYKNGIKFVTFSSDLVFDGTQNLPYTEKDAPKPLNVYGRSKALAEEYVTSKNPDALIVRTSAFFGPWDKYNFAFYVYKNLSECNTISVANDIYISPTYVPDLVNAVLDITIDGEKGIWHLANKGCLSWAEFATAIAQQFGMDKKYLHQVSAEDIGFKAPRPAYTALDSNRGNLLPSFYDALARYSKECKLISALQMETV